MKKNLYAIKDVKVGFLSPMIDTNNETAIRSFEYACKNNDMMFFTPSDFELYYLGEFDSDSGLFYCESPTFLCNGINFKEVSDD